MIGAGGVVNERGWMDGECGRRKISVLTPRMRGVWDEISGTLRELWQKEKTDSKLV